MKADNAIEVKGVTKQFKVFIDRGMTLKERILFSKRRKYEYRQVLKGIDFEVKKGEAIGLIGHNGCGKSTTLKLLTKIIYPDTGSIEVAGRVSSLIELGAGFHPDLSGRENIYINASIFGLNKKEIERRLEDIIAFSELEDFIDNPVRTYSSGMYMRLAFSVAINVDADVLLIDEILAVGDANFQAKCFNKLREIKAKGTTIVIVSHSLGQIEQICERSIWIHDGLVQAEGTPREVHPMYLDYMGQKRQLAVQKELEKNNLQNEVEEEKESEQNGDAVKTENTNLNIEQSVQVEKDDKRWGNFKAKITSVKLIDSQKEERQVYEVGEDFSIMISFHVDDIVKDAVVGIGIFRNDGLRCYGTNTRIDQFEEYNLEKDGIVEVRMKNVMLLPGKYSLDVAIESEIGISVDYYREVLEFEMYSKIGDVGIGRIQHDWLFQ